MPTLLALPPPDPGFEMLVSSQGMSQGLRQSEGVQAFPRAYVRFGDVQIGGQWRNITSPSASGVAALFVKFGRTFRRGQFDGRVLYRVRTGAKGAPDLDAWEFSCSGRRSFGRFGLQASADYSPKEFERGKSFYVTFGPSFDIDKATKVSAAIGRRERTGAPDYTAYNAGISRQIDRRLTVDARYYGTNRSGLGEPFRERIVVSARFAL